MFTFYAHTGSENHGCEAIVRASAKLLGNEITLFSVNPEQDIFYGADKAITSVIRDENVSFGKFTYPGIISRIQTKLTGSINKSVYYQKKKMFDSVKKNAIAFSIGGDNYCYPGTEYLAAQNCGFHKKGAKTVLWGCSVEPELLEDKNIAKDIASYDLITVRESISYNALKKVNKNTVMVSDPAFVLDKVELPLPKGWKVGDTIGINVSPLVMDSSKNSSMVYDAFVKLIKYIVENTDSNIALIPHVVWKSNDDRVVLNKLYDEFKCTERVLMIEDHNCMELKGYISRCRFFIGARTHATIAAYSTCVPTLVLGYSVKSIGIATDIFGASDNYVLPVQLMDNSDQLVDSFKWILNHEQEMKGHLKKMMPDYIRKAYIGKEAVDKLVNGGK